MKTRLRLAIKMSEIDGYMENKFSSEHKIKVIKTLFYMAFQLIQKTPLALICT